MQRQQQQQGEEEVRKTVRSAVVWIVPEEQWGRIQAVRAEHDKSYRRWPPHVNLLYPFVEEGQLIAANRQQRHQQQQSKTILERLGEACRGVQPFSVGLRAVGRFAHGARSHTLWVGPARGGAALVELQRRLQAAVPACDDLGRIEAAGFTPHVTLGQWRCSAADAAAAQRALAAEWASLPPLAGCCVVDRIAVITRRGDEPFAVRAVIPLGDGAGGGVPRWVDDSVPYVPSSSSSSSSSSTSAAGADCMQQQQQGQEHAEQEKQSTRLEMMVWSSERTAWLPTSSKSGSASTSHEESSSSSSSSPTKTALRIATWNVLHEPGLEARVAGATAGARAAAALAALEKVGADVAVLEEVSAEFRAALLGSDWVRGGFAVSAATSSADGDGDERGGGEGSRSAKTGPMEGARESRWQGIAVVVRRELAADAVVVRHSRFKQSVVVSVGYGGGATPGWPVRIAGVHLTSDFARGLDGVVGADAAARIKAAAREQGAQRRSKQLAEVAAACSASLGSGIGCGGGGGAAACVIAGDMNIGDGAQREWAGLSRLFPGAVVDCWKAAAGGAAGVTYDPERNAAAAATTQSGRRERFDRVLLWDPSGFAPTPSAASATSGAVAREEWHWWPVRAAMFGTEALPGTRESTGRGSGGEEEEEEEGLVTSASDHFGVVVDLELRAGRGDADAAAAAGVCDVGGSETGAEDAAALAAAVGESEEEGVRGSGSEEARAWAVVDAVRRAAEHGAPGRVVCAATGSLLLGVWRSGCGSEAKGSDVDIVCVGSSESRAAFFGRVSAGLRGSVAAGTTVPVLRGRMDGISVEVQYAQVSEEHLPTTVLGAAAGESQAAGTGAAAVVAGLARNTRAMRGLDEASVRALSGVADNAAVGAAVDAVGPAARGQFRGVVRAVKAWAVSRGVYAARMGFLGGLGWAVLAARAVQRIGDGAVSVGDALRRFFAMYAQWDFCGTPLSLVGHAPPPSASSQQQQQVAMIVWTPTRPHFNIARNATRSTVAALRQELQAAAGVLLEGAGQRMMQMQPQPPPWRMVFGASGAVRNALVGRGAYGEWLRSAGLAVGAVVAVTVSGLSKGGFERLRGAVEARLVGLVVRLERLCGGAAVARLFGTALWPPAGQHPHPHACCYGVSVAVPAGLVGSSDGSSIGTSTAGAAGYAVDVVGPAQVWEHGVVEDTAAAAAKAGDAFLSVRCFTPDKVPAWMLSDSALDSSADGDGCDDDDDDDEEEEGIAPQAAAAEMGDGNDDDDGRSRAGLVVRPGGSRAEKGKKGKQGTRRQQQEKEKEKEKRAASPTRGGKLRTSEDVYHRLRWDPALNAAEYTVCYEDRFLGLVEVAVDEFDTDTIPFHRVWVFKHRGDVVWDRQRRIDKVF